MNTDQRQAGDLCPECKIQRLSADDTGRPYCSFCRLIHEALDHYPPQVTPWQDVWETGKKAAS